MDQSYMKEKPVMQLILSMSLPMILSMMVNSLYNIVDSFFVAKISEKAMTALSLVYPVQNLINAVTIGFGVGMNAVIAFYLGAQEQEKADNAATQGLLLSVLHGLLLTAGCIAVMPSFLRSFSDDSETIRLGLQYSNIVFSFSAVIALHLSMEKIFQSVGKMTVSMVSMMTGCVANILLDPLLIFGFDPRARDGNSRGGHCNGTGTSPDACRILFLLLFPADLRQDSHKTVCLGQKNDGKTLFHRDSGNFKSGPALDFDLRFERHSRRF